MRLTLTIAFVLISCASAFSQWVIKPIQKTAKAKHITNPAARIQDTVLAPLSLPFWDDFSYKGRPDYPDTARWYLGESVDWSNGEGINPPSLGVISFNGLDSLGKPYDVTNSLAKGYGDHLVSWTIDLAAVPAAERDSVFFSMFFEFEGNGEQPDEGDHLIVEFKNDSSQWIPMATVNGDTITRRDLFYKLSIPVTDPHFFHDQFQFRIRSFGRISGPWDTWLVDYVYINKHRYDGDMSFPDRTVYQPLSSLLGDYWAVPAAHFHADTANIFLRPTFGITNLRLDQQQFNGQPVNFNTTVKIDEWKNKVPESSKTLFLDSAFEIKGLLTANERKIVTLNNIPKKSDFTIDSDSIRINLITLLNSGDNLIDTIPPLESDYVSKYIPIDFRVNDVTSNTHILSNYYAYDDGSAEFSAGLTQPGSEIAYRFNMVTDSIANILAVDLYFPNVQDLSSQTILLTIRKDTTETGIIYIETINVQRSALNRYVRHVLNRNTVQVKDHFYVGWQQTTSGGITIGLDESHDTSENIVFNVKGYWEHVPPDLQGSLMIRPVFGKGGVDTGLADEPIVLDVYPNPAQGTFFLSKAPDSFEILDFTGRRVAFTQEGAGDQLRVDMGNPPSGLYIIKAVILGRPVTRKVMVRP